MVAGGSSTSDVRPSVLAAMQIVLRRELVRVPYTKYPAA